MTTSELNIVTLDNLLLIIDDPSINRTETINDDGNRVITITSTVLDNVNNTIQFERITTYDKNDQLIDHSITFIPEVEIGSEYPFLSLAARELNPKTLAEWFSQLRDIQELESELMDVNNLSLSLLKELGKNQIEGINQISQIHEVVLAVTTARQEVKTQDDYDRIMRCFDYGRYINLLVDDTMSVISHCQYYKTILVDL